MTWARVDLNTLRVVEVVDRPDDWLRRHHRKSWSKGDALKRELALAWVAWRMIEHRGEPQTNAARQATWRPR